MLGRSTDLGPSCLQVTFNCTQLVPTCHNPDGFDFPTLWNITQRYFEQCPRGPWIFVPHGQTSVSVQEASLTLAAAVAIVATAKSWTVYSASDIWFRLTTWKFPLWQLVANSPRPPLGLSVECFSVVRLLGNPIGSIAGLLSKLHDCQLRADRWRNERNELNGRLSLTARVLSSTQQASLVKKLAILSDSYSEYGKDIGDTATEALVLELARRLTPTETTQRKQTFERCLTAANSLAADRSTKFFPIVVAQAFFVGNIVIALVRTKTLTTGPDPTTFINIEAYSIGFSALYYWITFAVSLSSVIGTSQTAAAIPRILGQLRDELIPITEGRLETLPNDFNKATRIRNGGIYSWQPGRRANQTSAWSSSQWSWAISRKLTPFTTCPIACPSFPRSFRSILPYLSLTLAASTGWLISYLVPPVGWGCRNKGELIIHLIWLFSHLVENALWFGTHHRAEFWTYLVKDFLCMGSTMGMVIATQIGIYNSPECYTLWGRTGLALPGMASVAATLSHNLDKAYPPIVAVGIGVQLLVLPVIVIREYRLAIRVFLQRDDEQSNFPMLQGWLTS